MLIFPNKNQQPLSKVGGGGGGGGGEYEPTSPELDGEAAEALDVAAAAGRKPGATAVG